MQDCLDRKQIGDCQGWEGRWKELNMKGREMTLENGSHVLQLNALPVTWLSMFVKVHSSGHIKKGKLHLNKANWKKSK